jgi:hypothetical protein
MDYVSASEGVIRRVAEENDNVRLIDPKAFLCEDGVCPETLRGTVVYTDEDHVSRTMSRMSASKFREDVAWLVHRAPDPASAGPR